MRYPLLLLMFLLLAVPAFPQSAVKVNYSSLGGVQLSGPDTFSIMSGEDGVIPARITNAGPKALSAYAFDIKIKLANGEVESYTQTVSSPLRTNQPLKPGASQEIETAFAKSRNGQDITEVSVVVEFAQFADGSAIGDAHSRGAQRLFIKEDFSRSYRKALVSIYNEKGLAKLLEEISR